MNSVSWFVYLAQVFGSLKDGLGIIGFLVTAGVIGTFVIRNVYAFLEDEPSIAGWPKVRYLAIGPAMMFLAAMIPNQNTMYAIAASEIGEKIVTSERARGIADDATKALHQWIRKQIDSDKKS